MKYLSLYISIPFLLFLLVFFTPTTHGKVADLNEKFLNVLQSNRTVITCYDKNDNIWGGQGTITQVDKTGVWVTTAAHVAHDAKYCDSEFRDGSVHTSYVALEFDKSDIAILFAPRAQWNSRASIKDLKLGEHLFVFAEDIIKDIRDSFGALLGLMFDFNNDLYDGRALSRMPAQLMVYTANKSNLVLTNLYSAPGSSGGGVFDDDGNLVGVVSGGSEMDKYVTYIVDVAKSYDEEFANVKTNRYSIR